MKDSLSRLFNALKKYSFVELARKIRLFIHANVFDRLNVFSYFHLLLNRIVKNYQEGLQWKMEKDMQFPQNN